MTALRASDDSAFSLVPGLLTLLLITCADPPGVPAVPAPVTGESVEPAPAGRWYSAGAQSPAYRPTRRSSACTSNPIRMGTGRCGRR